MEQIRVKKGIEICVNDNEDTIFLDVDNTLFSEKYHHLLERMEEISDSIDTEKELADIEVINLMTDKMKEVMTEVDNLFGENACVKIFGEEFIPTPYALMDFFEQITPIVERYTKAREDKILQKYGKRTGGKK